jgi:NAD(P)-dependent dehydrogenase (short-subunit alcohol dehydrogenase family)
MDPRPAVLISGCSTGIGRATARRFAAAGFPTFATARRPETLDELVGLGCRALPLDVTDPDSIKQVVHAVESEHGSVGVLVNNAGFGLMGTVEETPVDEIRRQYETNVFGLVALTQAALAAMRAAGRGRIVNVGSAGGEFTTPGSGIYQSTKYALESLNDAMRMELRPFGIRVALVQPGGVTTDFGRTARESTGTDPSSPYAELMAAVDRASERFLRPGAPGALSPDDVAAAIVKAATSRRPRTRYRVGAVSKVTVRLSHWLPDRAWDRLALASIR